MATVGSARSDEKGKIRSGKAGDQTGKEVSTQAFYMHKKGWYYIRPKSVTHANAIATAMLQACYNSKIGYDQNQRDTLLREYKKVGSIEKVNVKCETDCSALVRVCILQATGKDVGNIRTATMKGILEKSGLFEKAVSVTSESQLCTGDILVTKTTGHTVVVTSGKSRSASTSSNGFKYNSRVAEYQKAYNVSYNGKLAVDGKRGPKTIASFSKVSLKKGTKHKSTIIKFVQSIIGVTQDGSFGDKTQAAVKAYQKKHGLSVDGVVGPKTIAKMVS